MGDRYVRIEGSVDLAVREKGEARHARLRKSGHEVCVMVCDKRYAR